jgi:hypothetical protein
MDAVATILAGMAKTQKELLKEQQETNRLLRKLVGDPEKPRRF